MIHRIAAGLLIASLLTFSAASSAKAELRFVTHGQSNRIIIFIDGLLADPSKAFRWGEGVGSWPELMAADATSEAKQLPLERYDTAILSFAGAATDHNSVPQLAIRGLNDLKSKGVVEDYESVVFVAYGAGGLVLKSMLVQSATSGAAALNAKSRVAFLLSVPAQGRPAADFLTVLAAHEGLAVNFGALDVGVFLQGLESLWSEYLSKRGPTKRFEVYCRHENAATFGFTVAAGQYTTEGCDDNSEDRAADHQSIARPASRDAGVYRWVRTHLADYFQRFPSDPGKPKASSEVAAAEGATSAVPSIIAAKPAEAFTPAPATPAAAAVSASAAPVTPTSQTVNPRIAENGSTSPSQTVPDPVPRMGGLAGLHEARQPHSGDWTFAIKGPDCNLAGQLWVVQIHEHRLKTDDWNAKIASDGKFTVDSSGACATELVRGTVSGRFGSGWYLYANPCKSLYCRTRFQMTWRRPVPSSR